MHGELNQRCFADRGVKKKQYFRCRILNIRRNYFIYWTDFSNGNKKQQIIPLSTCNKIARFLIDRVNIQNFNIVRDLLSTGHHVLFCTKLLSMMLVSIDLLPQKQIHLHSPFRLSLVICLCPFLHYTHSYKTFLKILLSQAQRFALFTPQVWWDNARILLPCNGTYLPNKTILLSSSCYNKVIFFTWVSYFDLKIYTIYIQVCVCL